MTDDAEFDRLLGERLGTGAHRIAYAHARDPSLVIKVSRERGHASNRTEWRVWRTLADDPRLGPLFGRCDEISRSGQYLVMERLDDLATDEQRRTRRYPGWLSDLKGSAWGMSRSGAVKLRDYAFIDVPEGETLTDATIYDRPLDEELDALLREVER